MSGIKKGPYPQLDLFKGIELRDNGMEQASNHADSVHDKWTDIAFNFICSYIKKSGPFMVEEVRAASVGTVPEPPSARAWGSVIVRASRAGIIRHVGFNKVSNPKAHRTPASVWCKI